MAIIRMTDLKLRARIGVTDEERAFPSTLLVQVALELPIESGAGSDRIENTVDYGMVLVALQQVASTGEYCLLERFIRDCALALLEKFDLLQAVSIEASKDVFTEMRSVSVSERFCR